MYINLCLCTVRRLPQQLTGRLMDAMSMIAVPSNCFPRRPCSRPELTDGSCTPSLTRRVTLTAHWHGSRADQHHAGKA